MQNLLFIGKGKKNPRKRMKMTQLNEKKATTRDKIKDSIRTEKKMFRNFSSSSSSNDINKHRNIG